MGNSPNHKKLVKVQFRLDPQDWHGSASEGLWAEPIKRSRVGQIFQLNNSPFFARGVSFLDIVYAVPSTDGLGMEFAGVVERSGHSTYMLLVPLLQENFDLYWNKLEKLGCSFEKTKIITSEGEKILYTVDVPPAADIYAMYSILEQGEHDSVWIFQEGHVGHKLSAL